MPEEQVIRRGLNKKIISIENLFKETFNLFSKGIEPFLIIQAILFAITFGVVILMIIGIFIGVAIIFLMMAAVSEYSEALAVIIMVITITFNVIFFVALITLPSILSQAALIIACDDTKKGIKRKIKEYISIVWNRKWKIIGVYLLTALIVMVGFIFLIIPGIILSFFLIFAPFILILEKKSITESIMESFRLVKNNFWDVLVRHLVIYFAFMAVVVFSNFIPLANMAVNFLGSIFIVIYMYLLYKNVRGKTSN